ncbi:PREDICTED: von Willebrand factor [Nanorana parkeri]|uniref:von Willebrand factor n=1 Tax=Nanorana parkeri TaxID=125878 RepID=UPI000854CCF9|nr:PREDICTED: von Willebrand factor [Nanorana parkeri]
MRGLQVIVTVLVCSLTPGTPLDVFGKPNWSLLSRCSLFGENHIRTFDGTFYDFVGDCSYMVAGDCHKHTFSLQVDYRQGKKKSISMYLGEYYDIHMFFDGTATEGEKSISMPYASNGIYLENEAGYHKLSSPEHGIMVKIDVNGNVQIVFSNEHFNRSCGLCGNFNQFAEDDFLTQEGIIVEKSYEFANSWALHGGDKRCKRIYPPSNTCNISSEAAEKDLMQRCQLLKSSAVFAKCHQVVDPDPFIAICEKDMCECAEDVHCPCQTFLEYTRSCAQHGVIIHGWPKDTTCKPECPHGMEYNECVSPCVQTCQSLKINEVCQESCIDGCNCPEGKVLDGARCIDPSECSCVHAGKRYPTGAKITRDCNTCFCRHGLWDCSDEDCPGECFVTGQSHFKSFDNKYFTFSGICHFLLAKDTTDNTFSVAIETMQCADDPDAVCTRSASVRLLDMQNITIKFKHGGGVSVEGQDIMLPLLQGSLRIQTTALTSVQLSYRNDLQIDWDGHGKLLLKLSPAYSGSTSGLCGNYDGNQGDDFLSPSGLVEASVEDFGNSWKLSGDCVDLVKQDTDPCILNPKRARFAEDVCSALMDSIFQPCHNEVDPLPYLKNCRYDVCACSNGKECLCSAFSSYASACSRKGVLIEWRTPEFCPIMCPQGKIYQECGSPCNNTCRSLSHPDTNCREFCMEGCYCPVGLYTNEFGECVPKSECQCYYDGELFQPDDVFSNHHSMCYCEEGMMHCIATDIPGSYYADAYFSQSARVKRSLVCRPPMRKVICSPGDPTIRGTECTKTCQNYEFECMSPFCISGCLCPEGMVRHNSRCIYPSKCPCTHAGNDYAPGESVEIDCNTCVCRDRKWQCTNKVCDGTCSAIGVAHYLTFDGMKYNFPGDCQYVMVQDYCNGGTGSFRILIGNVGCGFSGEKCSKKITIYFRNGEIELANEQVTIRRPLSDETGFDMLQSGNFFILILGSEMSVTWDKGMRVYITLKETLREKVCGLCGNFDGIENNDLVSSHNQVEINPSNFGNSWKVNPLCADAAMFSAAVSMPFCQDNVLKQAAVEHACSILMGDIFQACEKLVDPTPYYEICTYDTCTCESIGDCACFCDSIAAYAHACTQKGVIVRWRSSQLCPQSCEEKNEKELEYVCEWRYNSCAPACPATCQHPEPSNCPLKCVEGCQAHCPPGKILNEVSETCIDPKDCPVCVVGGRHIPHGKNIFLNQDDPKSCQQCHCEDQTLLCISCETDHNMTSPAPTEVVTPTSEEEEEEVTVLPGTYTCEKAMDLVFLVDGSSKLSEAEFEIVKDFIVSILEKIRISQKRIRVSVVQYYSLYTPKLFHLKDKLKLTDMVNKVKNMKYYGSSTASTFEALKYASHYVFPEAPRDNAPKMIMLLTASKNQKSIGSLLKAVMKRKITVIPVAIGPNANIEEVKLIQSKSVHNKPFIVPNVKDLPGYKDKIIDYLCGLVPEPTTKTPTPSTPTTKQPHVPLTPAPLPPGKELFFLIETSNNITKENFTQTIDFLEKIIHEMDMSKEVIYITIIQYSYTVTLEYRFTGRETKQDMIQKIKEIRYRGGNATNTGQALHYISHGMFRKGYESSSQVPRLVYMIQSNPPTDTITKPDGDTTVTPIVIGQPIPQLNIFKNSINLGKYDQLRNITNSVINNVAEPVPPTLRPIPTTTPAVQLPCTRPMDVIFLLDGSINIKQSEFELMKTFVKNFIYKANIGPEATQVAVLQYGWTPQLEIAWTDPQNREGLIKGLDTMQKMERGPSKIGDALQYAVQSVISEVHGARPSSFKIAVILVADKSVDQVNDAADSATTNRISVFPIGVGSHYDEDELSILAGPSADNKITKLQLFEDLPTILLLGHDFINKLCTDFIRVCVDEDGNQRKAGDSWTLSDQCYTARCLPDGITTLESHRVNCMKIPKPVCDNNLPAIKVEETCGCRWVCPCTCKGSSNRHIVTFDGLNFKLISDCSYVLFDDKTNNVEVILQNGECSSLSHQTCMNSVQVKHNQDTVTISNNMQVSVNGRSVTVPYHSSIFEVDVYGAVMHEVKIPKVGFVFTFTPSINEFILQLNPHVFSSSTSGLCGICDHNPVNDFTLRDGSVTRDSSFFIKEWTLPNHLDKICETKLDDVCTQRPSTQCNILLSKTFEACHSKIQPSTYFSLCEESSCHGQDICEIIAGYSHFCRIHGVCIDWRTVDLCPMNCPSTMVYNHCRIGCDRDCGNTHNATVCSDHPTEGCFCPDGDVTFNGKCVSESVCTQCVDPNGVEHKHMERWIPSHEPCSICICLDNRMINCSPKPCPTVEPITCGPCEIPKLKKTSDQCCPEYECVCDNSTCSLPPVPHCEDGMVPVLTNPGECIPIYICECKRKMCPVPPTCPAHKTLTKTSTKCCDNYNCNCTCSNSTNTCPPGYISNILTDECGCTTVTCTPDQVCIHKNNVYRVGSLWEDGCQTCQCTDLKDSITGLRIVECVKKQCDVKCAPGFKYITRENECCGTCKRMVCEQEMSHFKGYKGDFDESESASQWYSVGAQWMSPVDPCIINECAKVNGEVFTLQKNVSCTDIETKNCPTGYELKCIHGAECCPICRCDPIPGCLLNGTIIGPGKTLMIDECSSCECRISKGPFPSYELSCQRTTCDPCPRNTVLQKVKGACCGKCILMSCTIMLQNGNPVDIEPNKSIRDGCDMYTCKANEQGELTLEKVVTSCPPLDRQKCLADGGKIIQLGDSCCETCEEPECMQVTGVLKFIRVDDCVTERQLNIHYCEGKCTSKSVYAIQTHRMEDQCICCSATQTEPMKVPLQCANGTTVEHEILQATNCECQSRKCTPNSSTP